MVKRTIALSVLAAALAVLAPPASAGPRGDGRLPAPAADEALRGDSPRFWLRRAAQECRAVLEAQGERAARSEAEEGARLTLHEALSLAAAGQMKAGDAAGLRDTLGLLLRRAAGEAGAGARALGYAEAADFYLQLGDKPAYWRSMDEAKRAAREIDEEFLRPRVDLRMAALEARAGDWNEADDVVRATQGPAQKAALYCALAMVAHDQRERAGVTKNLQYATSLAGDQDEETAGRILAQVGQAYTRTGDFDAARATAESIADPAARADLYEALARRQMKGNDRRGYRDSLDKARALAAKLPPGGRVWRNILLCYEQNDLNDRDGARQSLAAAASAAGEIPDVADRARALFDLADAHAHLGDVPGCLEVLGKAEGAWADSPRPRVGQADLRAGRYADLVASLARAGQLDAAERMARRVPAPAATGAVPGAAGASAGAPPEVPAADADAAARGWLALCEAQAKAGRLDAAKATLQRIVPPGARAQACRRVAAALAQGRDFAAAGEWIDRLPAPAERAHAAVGVAEALLGRRMLDLTAVDLFQLGIE